MNKSYLFLACLFLFSCGSKKVSISDFAWLQEKWEGNYDELYYFEQWKSVNGNSLEGIGGAISGKDTVFAEKIKIEQRGEDIFYIPTVKENGAPVDFKFTGYKNDSIIFENPQHDFPQRIIYFKLPDNKLYACVDGLNKGKYKREEFYYKREERGN